MSFILKFTVLRTFIDTFEYDKETLKKIFL